MKTPRINGDLMGIASPTYDFSRFSGKELTRRLDLLAATGVRWMRTDLWLEGLISVKGRAPNFATVDPVVGGLVARGIAPVLCAHTMPAYARNGGANSPGTQGPVTDAQRKVYTDFMVAAVKHYKGVVKHWEIWNEPNLHVFWKNPSVDQYARLLRASYTAIKAADKNAVVISGGTGGASPGTRDIDAMAWVTRLYENEDQSLHRYASRVAIHAYTDSVKGNIGEFYRLNQYRDLMSAHGDAKKYLWITEGGSHVLAPQVSRATEKAQAQFYEKIAVAWASLPYKGPLFWFSLFNNGGTDYTNDSCGMIRDDNRTPRPAYRTLQDVTQRSVRVP